jgi:hypothetical protein
MAMLSATLMLSSLEVCKNKTKNLSLEFLQVHNFFKEISGSFIKIGICVFFTTDFSGSQH